MTSSSVTTVPSRRRCHVAMCPFPFTSHAALMLNLARKITGAAPSLRISFFTTASTAATLNLTSETEPGTNFRVRHVDDGGPTAPGLHPAEAIKALVAAVGDGLGKAVAEAEEEVGDRISCVVADAMMTFACRQIVAERGATWVAMWAAAVGGLVAHMNTDLLRSNVGGLDMEALKDKTIDQYISGFPPIPINDLPHEVLAINDPIARILHDMSLHISDASAVIINSFQALEPAATDILNAAFPNKFHCAGPFTLTMSPPPGIQTDPHGCLPWLDSHAPASVVYISFGSGHAPPLEEFASLAEALEEARVPFLWSLPDKFKSHLPAKKMSLGKMVPWAPQTAVLAHVAVGAQLTHGGWNSVLESIVSGVPMICRLSRVIADHAFNGRMVVDPELWGVGVEVEGGRLTKAETMAALEKVMNEKQGCRMGERIKELKRLAKESVTEPNGSSAQNLRNFINVIIK